MSKLLFDLEDCQITDTGGVLVKYETLFKRLRSGERVEALTVIDNEDVRLYNMRNPEHTMQIEHITGKEEAPPVQAYRFNIPEQYWDLDIDEYMAERLVEKFPRLPEVYMERLTLELRMMRERHMEEFIRLLIYLYDRFASNGVIHGIGRGSACASLVLYLIGIHMVDPIEYDIPIGEFLR